MAIVFTKEVAQDRLLFAFNNNIIRFSSLSPDAITAEINGFFFDEAETLPIPIILYPHPDGRFYFNFKEHSSVLANKDNFRDDLILLEPALLFDWTDKIYFNQAIEVKINFENETFETSTFEALFLSAYSQIDEIDFVLKTNKKILSPSNKLKFWKGLPFDFTTFNTTEPTAFTVFDIKKEIGINQSMSFPITRILVSDGRFLQPIFTNIGQAEYSLSNTGRGVLFSIDTIVENCFENKLYVKWINRFGGWNYWLFSKGNKTLNVKSIGELNNDFNDVDDTISQTINMGVNSKSSIYIEQDVKEEDLKLMEDLAESPKIYLFKGIPNQASTLSDWIEITLKDKSIIVKPAKLKFSNIQFDIELPQRTTRTI